MNQRRKAARTEPFDFYAPGWQPQLLSWSDYERLLRKQLEEELDKYERACRSLAEEKQRDEL